MTTIDEARVEAHYTRENLLSTIRDGLTAAGFDPDSPDASALSAVDEFHIGGSEASRFVGEALGATSGLRVLDIGCGIGGPARFMASTFGCRVTGIDLTADYVAVGNQLSAMVGLAEAVTLQQASALDLPFSDGSTGDGAGFDAAYVMHVGMNIADKPRMMAEAARVLRPGGKLVVYDVMTQREGSVTYPLPWSDVPENSAVDRLSAYKAALHAAGLVIEVSETKRDFAVGFFEAMVARMNEAQAAGGGAAGGPGPLGLHLLMGANTREKVGNVFGQIKEGLLAPVLITCRKPG
ncbi:MAG: methyltransferase domain-containing protein [Pseudomonadota bacterium]|nr:methyltransferase domain-containing protein [Pseudomonadota bacterium]